jgi:hypothetical protein
MGYKPVVGIQLQLNKKVDLLAYFVHVLERQLLRMCNYW